MTTSDVDTRVVQMKFDNEQFEAGVKQTMKSLAALDESLNIKNNASAFDEAAKSADNLTDSVTETDKAVQSMQSSFSALQVIGTTALVALTLEAMKAGKRIANYIYDPLVNGGKRRALNIAKAKFSLEGLGVAWDDIKGDIDYGVKDTAYGLDAAANAAASLKASGIDIGDNMKVSLRAISGVAAQTNRAYEDVAHIFTTVAGNGRLMGQQLSQLSAYGLNAAATLADYMNKVEGTAKHTEAEIRDLVSKGKISYAEFTKAMYDAFGEHAVKANETFEGSLSNIRSALGRIGAEFASPVYENAVTVFNSIRESINVINKTLGELGVYKWFSALTYQASQFASSLLGSKYLVATVFTILYNIYRLAEIVTNAFKKAFNIDGEGMAKALYEFVSIFRITQQDAFALEDIFVSLFTIMREFGALLRIVMTNIVLPALPIITKGISFTLRLLRAIIFILTDSSSPIANILKLVRNFIATGILVILHGIKNILEKINLKTISSILTVIVGIVKVLAVVLYVVGSLVFGIVKFAVNNLSKIGSLLLAIAKTIGAIGIGLGSILGNGTISLFNGVKDSKVIKGLSSGIDKLLGKNSKLEESNTEVAKSYEKLNNNKIGAVGKGNGMVGFQGAFSGPVTTDQYLIKDKTKELEEDIDDLDGAEEKVRKRVKKSTSAKYSGLFYDFFSNLADAIGLGGSILDKALTGVGATIQMVANAIGNAVKFIFSTIYSIFDLTPVKGVNIALMALTGLVIVVVATIYKVLTSVFSFFDMSGDTMSDRFMAFGDMIKNMAIAFLILSAALKLFIGEDEIKELRILVKLFLSILDKLNDSLWLLLGAEGLGFASSWVGYLKPAAANPTWKAINSVKNLILSLVASFIAMTLTLKLIANIKSDVFAIGVQRMIGLAALMITLMMVTLAIANKLGGGGTNMEFTGGASESFGGGVKGLFKSFLGLPSTRTLKADKIQYQNPLGGVVSFIMAFTASMTVLYFVLKGLGKLKEGLFMTGLVRLVLLATIVMAFLAAASAITNLLLSGKSSNIIDDYAKEKKNEYSTGIKKTNATRGDASGPLDSLCKFLTSFTSAITKLALVSTMLGVLPKDVIEKGIGHVISLTAIIAVFLAVASFITSALLSGKSFSDSNSFSSDILNKNKAKIGISNKTNSSNVTLNDSTQPINALVNFLNTFVASISALAGVSILLGVLPQDSIEAGISHIANIAVILGGLMMVIGITSRLIGSSKPESAAGIDKGINAIKSILKSLAILMGIMMAGLVLISAFGKKGALDKAAPAINAVTGMMSAIMLLTTGIYYLASRSKSFKIDTKAITSIFATIVVVSLAATGMLLALSKMNVETAPETIGALTGLIATLVTLSSLIVIASSLINGSLSLEMLGSLAMMIVTMAATMGIISIALQSLSGIDPETLSESVSALTEMLSALSAFMTVMTILTGIMALLSTITGGGFTAAMAAIGTGLLIFAGASMAVVIASLYALGPALTSFSNGFEKLIDLTAKMNGGDYTNIASKMASDMNTLAKAILQVVIVIGILMGVLILVTSLAGTLAPTFLTGIMAIAAGLLILIALWELARDSLKEMLGELANLITAMNTTTIANGEFTLTNESVENLSVTMETLITAIQSLESAVLVAVGGIYTMLTSGVPTVSSDGQNGETKTDDESPVSFGGASTGGGQGALGGLKVNKAAYQLDLSKAPVEVTTSDNTSETSDTLETASETMLDASKEYKEFGEKYAYKGAIVTDEAGIAFTPEQYSDKEIEAMKERAAEYEEFMAAVKKGTIKTWLDLGKVTTEIATGDYLADVTSDPSAMSKDTEKATEVVYATAEDGAEGGVKAAMKEYLGVDMNDLASIFSSFKDFDVSKLGDALGLDFGSFDISSMFSGGGDSSDFLSGLSSIFGGTSGQYSDEELEAIKFEYKQLTLKQQYGTLSKSEENRMKDLEDILIGGRYSDNDFENILNGILNGDFSSLSNALGLDLDMTDNLANNVAKTSGLGSGINDRSTSSINQVNSNNTFTFTQNNYSPEALSRTELYKQTRSQLQDWTGFMRAQPSF